MTEMASPRRRPGGSPPSAPGQPTRAEAAIEPSSTHNGFAPGFTDFPQRLKRFKEESGLSWAEIARRLGADPKTVGGGTRTASGPTPTISWPYRTSQRAGGSVGVPGRPSRVSN